MKAEERRYIEQTLALFNSMINSGEFHSRESKERLRFSMLFLEKISKQKEEVEMLREAIKKAIISIRELNADKGAAILINALKKTKQ